MKKVIKNPHLEKYGKYIIDELKGIKNGFIKTKIYIFFSSSYFALHSLYILLYLFLSFYFINVGGLKPEGNISQSQIFPINIGILIGIYYQIFQSLRLFKLERDTNRYKKELSKKGFMSYIEYEYKKFDNKKSTIYSYLLNTIFSVLGIYIALYSAKIIEKDYISEIYNALTFEDRIVWLMSLMCVFYIFFMLNSFNNNIKLRYFKKMHYSEYSK